MSSNRWGQASEMTGESLRNLVIDCCGFDPGYLGGVERLDDIELSGITRLMLIATVEDVHGIHFPADLLSALETVDDLLYFTNVKVDQDDRLAGNW